jgi:hypothetical protein
MKFASKFAAVIAVLASFSSFAADLDLTTSTIIDVASAGTAISAAGTDGAVAGIAQATGSFAYIDQTGVNVAFINQTADKSLAAIVQTGAGNTAVIMQKAGQ